MNASVQTEPFHDLPWHSPLPPGDLQGASHLTRIRTGLCYRLVPPVGRRFRLWRHRPAHRAARNREDSRGHVSAFADLRARGPLLRARRRRWLEGSDGKRYLDFGGGIAVNALGYAHPRLVAALTEQAQQALAHFQPLRVPGQESLARSWSMPPLPTPCFSPIPAPRRSNCAIKMARRYHFATVIPNASASSLSKAPFTAAPSAPRRRPETRNISKVSAPGRRLRPGAVRRYGRSQGDRPDDRRLPDRADPGRGRRASGIAGISARLARARRRTRPDSRSSTRSRPGSAAPANSSPMNGGDHARHHDRRQGHRRRLSDGRGAGHGGRGRAA